VLNIAMQLGLFDSIYVLCMHNVVLYDASWQICNIAFNISVFN